MANTLVTKNKLMLNLFFFFPNKVSQLKLASNIVKAALELLTLLFLPPNLILTPNHLSPAFQSLGIAQLSY